MRRLPPDVRSAQSKGQLNLAVRDDARRRPPAHFWRWCRKMRARSAALTGGGLPSIDDDEIGCVCRPAIQRPVGNENRVAAIQRINQQQHAADREEPDRHRDHALACTFRRSMHHEAHGKETLRNETNITQPSNLIREDVVQIISRSVIGRHRSRWASLLAADRQTPARSMILIHSRSKP